MFAHVDPKEQLLSDVLYRSMTTTETDTRRLHLIIEASKCLVLQKEIATAKAARLAKEQARTVRRHSSYISSSSDNGTMTHLPSWTPRRSTTAVPVTSS